MKFKFLRSLEFYFFTFLILINIMPVLAPIFSAIGLHELAEKVYLLYSFFCHQFDTRSIHVFDHQYAWCARDTGIWLGVLVGSLLLRYKILKGINFWKFIIFIIPIGLDGGIQTLNTMFNLSSYGIVSPEGYFSNNLTRFLTGAFFGIGVALFLAKDLVKTKDIRFQMSDKRFKIKDNFRDFKLLKKQWFRIFLTMFFMFFVYVFLIFIWDITSSEIKPTNALDSVPNVQDGFFFERRRNGECPTSVETGILNFECLL